MDTESVTTADTHSPAANMSTLPSTSVSPMLSRVQTELPPPREKEKDTGMPSVMSILSSFGGNASRSQSVQPHFQEEVLESRPEPFNPTLPSMLQPPAHRLSLVTYPPPPPSSRSSASSFFTPFSLEPKNLLLSVEVYKFLLRIVTEGQSTRARLTALQFLMRLRADRDHNLYYVSYTYEPNGLVASLGALINRI